MNNPLYRPPAEAYSFILQVDEGCPYNACTFCGMYKGVTYSSRNIQEIRTMLDSAPDDERAVKRVFLADGDVMRRSFEELSEILKLVRARFPRVLRINTYATGTGILTKTVSQLRKLREMGLHTLYLGLESGDEETLKMVLKGETVEQMVDASNAAQTAGLRMSVMVLLGLAGEERSNEHALNTALALNSMQPRLLSCLRVVPVPGTKYHQQVDDGKISQLSESSVIRELRLMLKSCVLKRTVFRANHSSNVVPLEARLPRDMDILLKQLDSLLASDLLDDNSPGILPEQL